MGRRWNLLMKMKYFVLMLGKKEFYMQRRAKIFLDHNQVRNDKKLLGVEGIRSATLSSFKITVVLGKKEEKKVSEYSYINTLSVA